MSDYETASTYLKAEQIRSYAEQLQLLPFPSRKAKAFASLIEHACEKVKLLVLDLSRGTVKKKEDTDRLISFISLFLVDQLAPVLRFIEGASSENTPMNLVVPLEKIGEMLLPDARFLVRRQWRYNYRVRELQWELRQNMEPLFALKKGEIENVFGKQSEKLYAISFPSFERDNALLHVCFAHELGHPFQGMYLAADRENSRPLALLREQIKEAEEGADVVKQALDIGRAISLWHAAVAEIISDTISALVFGPSALFALREIASLSHSMDEVSKDLHPPWRFRLRHVLLVLQECGFVHPDSHKLQGWPEERQGDPAIIAQVKTGIDDWLVELHAFVEDKKDMEAIGKDVAERCAYEAVNLASQSIRNFASNTVGKNTYTKEAFREEVPALLERLYHALPPNQIEVKGVEARHVVLASILASGWLYKLTKLHGEAGFDGESYVKQVLLLNRLILKAIELSVVVQEFNGQEEVRDGTA